ncbi:MAG: hypothetical protein ACRYG7_38200 [Janthinobacterium lividum]
MSSSLTPVEQQIAHTLQAGHTLTVRWDCGGDESFVYTAVDDQELDTDYRNDQDLAYLLDGYLTEQLNLPSAGDFSMRGTGRILQEGQEVVINYQSESWADSSWMDDLNDEELAEIGCTRPAPTDEPESEEPAYEFDADYSGRLVLFTLS